ncbi:GTP cyclohydrolase I FolE2 [Candidimonas sp. SYP-B2681]|uniref:GTP cyclohydrolase FolE2 n=1 Tax=Candidimonas sp. SYP-B2681 TaxID=2497686 RepID=UPI000F8769CF|nr:GTP cyclohydrolase FolE2 [Candidimonas sp. SYP-B2681]RTZ44462.1 GTP cyclohydrolase I FolE2 [Candidimonas sp. SYP-B2681]
MNILIDSAVAMPDVQSSVDTRHIAIERVGVRGVRHPMMIAAAAGDALPTVATWELTVALPAHEKGTHMSRFVALLERYRQTPMTPALFCEMGDAMLTLLNAEKGDMAASFPYFMMKVAPVSGVASLMDYEVKWTARVQNGDATQPDVGSLVSDGLMSPEMGQPAVEFQLSVLVPVTSLCPCSKAISEYGAHNQRSHITVDVVFNDPSCVDVDSLIRSIEQQASCELWGLLKRGDEKFVTERAYENPKFVEDLVRDVAVQLKKLPGMQRFKIEAENFESIHNHSAYAVVEG